MDAYKIPNIFENLKKVNIIKERSNISKQKPMKIKSKPHQNYLWAFRALLIFFKIIGLATFAYSVTSQKKDPQISCTFQYSKIGIIYNAVLTILMIASNFLSLSYDNDVYYENKTDMTEVIETFQAILGNIAICAILICYCFGMRSLVRIANRLINIEHELDRQYSLYPSLRRKRVFRVLTILLVLEGSLAVTLLICEYLAFFASPISWLSDFVPTFHIGCFMIQYYLLVTVIEANFADVNQAIQRLSAVSTPVFRSQSLYQSNGFVINNSSVHQLLQLRDVHYDLCELSQDISDFYSTPIVFGFSFMFFSLMYNSYYLISPLIVNDEILEIIVLINTILWVVLLTYPIILLTTAVTKIVYEMAKTGNVIHKILSCTVDNMMKSELKQFSLQLLHRKIDFTASGYFTLDNAFFHSVRTLRNILLESRDEGKYNMLGAVTTYLVILVQFQMGNSSNSCNCTQENSLNTDE